jgi:hypothetical protein
VLSPYFSQFSSNQGNDRPLKSSVPIPPMKGAKAYLDYTRWIEDIKP